MKRELTHEEAFTALDAVALDALDTQERDAVLAHAALCTVCQLELTQLRDTTSHLAFSVPRSPAALEGQDRVRSRLMARASRKPTRRVPEWIALAAGILLVASVSYLASVMKDRENLRASLRVAVMSRDSIISELTGPAVAMMTLTSSGAKAPFARMFWDQAHNMWTLVAHNMPALKPGRTYQLWLMTTTAKISAGTFDPRDGSAMVRAMVPMLPSQLKGLAVTEEPAGGMPQPTSAPILAVSAQ